MKKKYYVVVKRKVIPFPLHSHICNVIHEELKLECGPAVLLQDLTFAEGIASDSSRPILLAEIRDNTLLTERDRSKIELNVVGVGSKNECLRDLKDFEDTGDLPEGITKELRKTGIFTDPERHSVHKLIPVNNGEVYLLLQIF